MKNWFSKLLLMSLSLCIFVFPFSIKAEVLNDDFDLSRLKGLKLGYYIGSFDPIHLGHQHVIEEALKFGYVDYVLIYPAPGGDQFKNRTDLALRQKMIASVYQEHPKVLLTYWTPKELQDKFNPFANDIDVVGIIGSDVVTETLMGPDKEPSEKYRSVFMRGIPLKDKHYEDTVGALMALKANSFLVALRGEIDLSYVDGRIYDRSILAFIPSKDLSSTEVRNAIKNEEPFEQFLSFPVQTIIKQEGLYGFSTNLNNAPRDELLAMRKSDQKATSKMLDGIELSLNSKGGAFGTIDELYNQDDSVSMEQLKENLPTNQATVIRNYGGHMVPHWRSHSQEIESFCQEEKLHFQFMKTSQGKVAYVDSGGTGFPIVFVHGNSCSLEVFKKQLAHFSGQYRVIAIDLPGHGKSENASCKDTGYTIPSYAKILDEVTRNLQLNQFVVVGFSLGGNIALQWTQITENMKGVMIVSSAPMKYSEDSLIAYPPYEGSYSASPDPLTESQARQYMGTCGFDTEDPDVYFIIKDAMRTDGAARAKMVASVLAGNGVDETNIVNELTFPLAVVIGKEDPCVGIEYITHLPYRNLWRNHVQVLPNAQHAVVYHQADQLNLLLEDFVSELLKKEESSLF